MIGGRDRDGEGRARQARPRDELGRPLSYGEQGVEPVEETPLPPQETLDLARRLLSQGRPFAAHEVLEVRWKSCPVEERELWQGLAQLCVGLTHAARGNHVGAQRPVERAAGRLDEHQLGGGRRTAWCSPSSSRARVKGCGRTDRITPLGCGPIVSVQAHVDRSTFAPMPACLALSTASPGVVDVSSSPPHGRVSDGETMPLGCHLGLRDRGTYHVPPDRS